MGRQVPCPLVAHVDNAAGVSYQHTSSTRSCASESSKLVRGVYDQRSDWVKELKDQSSVTAIKVKTEKNLAGLYTKCHAAPVRRRLQKELEEVAAKIAAGH